MPPCPSRLRPPAIVASGVLAFIGIILPSTCATFPAPSLPHHNWWGLLLVPMPPGGGVWKLLDSRPSPLLSYCDWDGELRLAGFLAILPLSLASILSSYATMGWRIPSHYHLRLLVVWKNRLMLKRHLHDLQLIPVLGPLNWAPSRCLRSLASLYQHVTREEETQTRER